MIISRASDIIRNRELEGTALGSGSTQQIRAEASLSEGIRQQLEHSPNLKVAIAQMKPLATRLSDNVNSMKAYIDRSEAQGVDVVIFPELTIPGYLTLDLANDIDFVRANIEALKEIVDYTKDKKVTVIGGFIDYEETGEVFRKFNFFNSAAVIESGKIVDVIDKTLLPDYNIFWESRNFKPSTERHTVDIKGHKVGLQICEDLWDRNYSVKVSDELKNQGAELLVNISASPFEEGKYITRQELVQGTANKQGLPIIYSNMVGVQDGNEGEIVFDGRSMVCLPGNKVVALGKSFEEDLLIVDLNKPKEVVLPEWAPADEVYHALVLGIKEYCSRNGFKRVYIGLSGGIDSAVTAALATAALGPENVIGITMPMNGITSDETFDDALRLASLLGIRCDIRPIGDLYRAWLEGASKQHPNLQSITKQNQQARARGQILMEMANEDRDAMVLNTGNKTESALGYMTLYGDMCGGLAALGDVDKAMVYELAEFINNINEREVIPYTTVGRLPSAELEPGQADRDNLPADYPVLVPLVNEIIKKEKVRAEIRGEFGEAVTNETLRKIARNEFKRQQAPRSIRVSSIAFGAGRRIPIDSTFF